MLASPEFLPIAASRAGLCRLCCLVCSVSVVSHYLRLMYAAAWAGSLVNGPIADRIGRKLSINLAVIVFTIGSAIQCGAVNIPMLFAGMWKLSTLSDVADLSRTSDCGFGCWSAHHGRSVVHFRGL